MEKLRRSHSVRLYIACHFLLQLILFWLHGGPDVHHTKGPDHDMVLENQAYDLWRRFNQSGDIEDLEKSILLDREALALRPVGHPSRSFSFNKLGIGIMNRFEQRGIPEDLDESIDLHQKGLSLRPEGHPDHWKSLNNLANALGTRFMKWRRPEDLEDSIDLYRKALSLHPEGQPDRSISLNNLAGGLMTRHKRGDLDEAINLQQESLKFCPESHPNHSILLLNLATELMACFKATRESLEDLDKCIDLYRKALSLRPEGYLGRSNSLKYLAKGLLFRFDRRRRPKDLDESIDLFQEALRLCPEGHPDRSISLDNLAVGLMERFIMRRRTEDFDESMQLRESAALHSFSSLEDRLSIAVHWAAVAQPQGHRSTPKAYEIALSLLQRILTISPTFQLQHEILVQRNRYLTLASDAASYFIEIGDIKKAIEMLEQGRGLLWSQMRGFRTPLDNLRMVNSSLASKLDNISKQLETLLISSDEHIITSSDSSSEASAESSYRLFNDQLNQKRLLSKEQEVLTERIREIPGFEDFLKTTPFDKLQLSADEGPVIIINHSDYRSDAIILLRGHGPMVVPLSQPASNESEAGRDTSGNTFYEEALYRSIKLMAVRWVLGDNPRLYNDTLMSMLEWLWENIVSLVVKKLNELGVKKQSRIWWCPTSVLNSLPPHAAGPYRDESNARVYLLDEYVSSSTPTLTALIQARAGLSAGSTTVGQIPKLLAIGYPGKILRLANVPKEIGVVRKHADKCLEEEEATKAAVLENLRDNNWVHFSCHGHLKHGNPFDSSFELFNDER